MEVRWRNWDLDWDRTWKGFEITWMELWMEVRRDLHEFRCYQHDQEIWMKARYKLGDLGVSETGPGWKLNRDLCMDGGDVGYMGLRCKSRDLDWGSMWPMWCWEANTGTWWRWDANTGTWIDMRRNLDGVDMQIAGPREPRWRWDVIWVKLGNTCKSREVEGCETQVSGHGWRWLGWGLRWNFLGLAWRWGVTSLIRLLSKSQDIDGLTGKSHDAAEMAMDVVEMQVSGAGFR